jgi:hypothetical protein
MLVRASIKALIAAGAIVFLDSSISKNIVSLLKPFVHDPLD